MPRYPIRPRSRQPRAHPEEQALIGTTLAHYRITAALGEGGMGEVYRVTDEKLGREVALKLLPAGMAAGADRLERFRREAKASPPRLRGVCRAARSC
jgi:serine/threonine protein kinase